MINFLHNFNPGPILFSFGPVSLHWYGLFMAVGIISALLVAIRLADQSGISKGTIYDLSFWLIVWGLVGARIYDVLLELPYYIERPSAIIKIWQGGLAIHGAIIAGLLVLIFYAKRRKLDFWILASFFMPGLALAQAIGRWGNYFNQELFGRPTDLPWGIPIDIANRPINYLDNIYFHPTFLYESIGNLIIFVLLLFLYFHLKKLNKLNSSAKLIVLSYLLLYSLLRFFLEFIRIDYAPVFFGLRMPQIASLLIFIFSIILLVKKLFYEKTRKA